MHTSECLASIREFTGGQSETFYESKLVRDAVLRNLQTPAEPTQRLSNPLKAAEPGIPWEEIAAFRNVLTHDYLGIDLITMLSVVESNLPTLEAAIERMTQAIASAPDVSRST